MYVLLRHTLSKYTFLVKVRFNYIKNCIFVTGEYVSCIECIIASSLGVYMLTLKVR